MSTATPEFVCSVEAEHRLGLESEAKTRINQIQEAPELSNLLANQTVGVKDLFHIAGLPTGAGNPDWLASHDTPTSSAWAVLQLVAAGAEIIAKTQTDELAYSLNGLNQHYPTPINPAAPDRLPGGSSSGSAVAVANRNADIGLGTDTGGSVRVPASYNGLFGLRTSHNLVSREGLVALAPGFDTVGWLARDYDTLMTVSRVMLPPGPSHGFGRAVVLLPYGVSKSWQRISLSLVELLAADFDSVQLVDYPQAVMAQASEAFRVLQGRQIWQQHGAWIESTQPEFAPDITERFNWCKRLNEADQQQAQTLVDRFKQFWHQESGIDSKTLVLLPTTPSAAPLLNTPALELAEYRNSLMGLTAPAGLLGAVQLSVPVLQDQNAPWGLSLLAAAGLDRSLLAQAQKLMPKLAGL